MTAAPLMRVTSIDLDEQEMPAEVAVVMSWPVWDRLCRDHRALRSVARQDPHHPDLWRDRFPIEWVARTAGLYSDAPLDDPNDLADPVGLVIWRSLSKVCDRFWPGGVGHAIAELTARRAPMSETEPHDCGPDCHPLRAYDGVSPACSDDCQKALGHAGWCDDPALAERRRDATRARHLASTYGPGRRREEQP